MSVTENLRQKPDKKKNDSFLRDYISRLTDEDFRSIELRLKHRLTGDVADAVNLMSQNDEMDNYLKAAKSADEFYDILDAVQRQIERDSRRRHG